MNWLGYLLAGFSGGINTVQAGANAQLRKSLDQPVLAGLAVYATGLAGLLLAALFPPFQPPFRRKTGPDSLVGLDRRRVSIFSTMAGLLFARKLVPPPLRLSP